MYPLLFKWRSTPPLISSTIAVVLNLVLEELWDWAKTWTVWGIPEARIGKHCTIAMCRSDGIFAVAIGWQTIAGVCYWLGDRLCSSAVASEQQPSKTNTHRDLERGLLLTVFSLINIRHFVRQKEHNLCIVTESFFLWLCCLTCDFVPWLQSFFFM